MNGDQNPGLQLQCWHWTGAYDYKSRPRFHYKGKNRRAKRALFEILIDEDLPDAGKVISICQNHMCVRPEHILLCNHNDAKACGPSGHISCGIPFFYRQYVDEGYTVEQLAVAVRVSVSLIKALVFEGAVFQTTDT